MRVKVYMVYKGWRVSRKQTRAAACGVVSPSVAVFNEAFLFNVDPGQSLVDTTVELVLVDSHRVTRDDYVGRLILSPLDQWRQPSSGDVSAVRGPLGGVGCGQRPAVIGDVATVRGPLCGVGCSQRPAVAGSDRPVAVWHRLIA